MKFNWSLLVSLCALLISVLSPAITAVINNRHERKMRKLDFMQSHQTAALEKFLRAAGAVCGNGTPDNFAAYWASSGEVYLYIPSSLWPVVDEINEALRAPDYENAQKGIAKFSKSLAALG